VMDARSASFRRQAALHADQEDNCMHVLEVFGHHPADNVDAERKHLRDPQASAGIFLDPDWLAEALRLHWKTLDSRERLRVWALQRDHHARLRRQYERASAQPWTVLTPDPPEPTSPLFEEPIPEAIACPAFFR
jgi:hypothetical protein